MSQTNRRQNAKEKGYLLLLFHKFLCFKAIRDIIKCFLWHGTNYFIAHFLRPKMIRDKICHAWFFAHCLVAQFLCSKMVRDKRELIWFFAYCLITHLLRHWKIFCHVQQDGAKQQEKFIFKQVNHFYLYTWAGQGLNFMVHHFAFITLVFKSIAKIYIVGCISSN